MKQTLLCAVGGASSSRIGASKKQLMFFWMYLFLKLGTAQGAPPELGCAIAREADHDRGGGSSYAY